MFSRNMQAIYKRFLILGLLSMCLFVFGYSDKAESVGATAICYQQCESSEARCMDSCATACSTNDADCNTCVQNCDNQFRSCVRFSIYCNNPGPLYNSICQVGYADHCVVVGGQSNCADPSAHSGYFLICNTTGGNQCVSCPDHEFCTGSGGLPPCF